MCFREKLFCLLLPCLSFKSPYSYWPKHCPDSPAPGLIAFSTCFLDALWSKKPSSEGLILLREEREQLWRAAAPHHPSPYIFLLKIFHHVARNRKYSSADCCCFPCHGYFGNLTLGPCAFLALAFLGKPGCQQAGKSWSHFPVPNWRWSFLDATGGT